MVKDNIKKLLEQALVFMESEHRGLAKDCIHQAITELDMVEWERNDWDVRQAPDKSHFDRLLKEFGW